MDLHLESILDSPAIDDRQVKEKICAMMIRNNITAVDLANTSAKSIRGMLNDVSEVERGQIVAEIVKWKKLYHWTRSGKFRNLTTSFHEAARTGNLKKLVSVFQGQNRPTGAESALVNHMDVTNCNRTALMQAVVNGHFPVLKLLVDNYKADVYAKDSQSDEMMAIHLAAEYGRLYCVKHLTSAYPDLLMAKTKSNDTPLNRAAMAGQNAVVDFLLEKCPQVVENYGKDDRTCLLQAVAAGHLKIVKQLLAKGANLFAIEGISSGNSAIHIAAKHGHVEVIEELIKNCPKLLDEKNSTGQSALVVALEYHQEAAAEFLLSKMSTNSDTSEITP